jgi:glycosyltransferase involved in cell wall biosynthesis
MGTARRSPDVPRIHWFSPLAPALTDIAHYTGRLLAALAARAEVTLWTDQPRWSSSLERLAAVRRFDPREFHWQALSDADAVFYNIGNNARFHSGIALVARRFPGFPIMHDVLLHDAVSHACRLREDRAGYLEIMQSLYGPRGRRDAELCWSGALKPLELGRLYSCAPYFLESSLGAIVHSRAAERTLAKEVDVPLIRLPLPFPARRSAASAAAGAPAGPPWKLVVFGFLGVNRCLEQILTALARLPDHPFHLHIYGRIEDREGTAAAIERLDLGRRVTLHGFVPEVELDAALASAHLALNLRYPTKGEASGSQLRIWSHGLPGVATRIGWYAEQPTGTLFYVRPAFLVEDLCAHLRAFAARPAAYRAAGLRGYEYFVEHHSPAGYAARIVDLARQATAYRQRWNALRMSTRAVETMRDWYSAGKLNGYVDRVAEVVSELT